MKKNYLNITGVLFISSILLSCSKENLEESQINNKELSEESLFRSSDGYTDIDFYNYAKDNSESIEIPEIMKSLLKKTTENNFLSQSSFKTKNIPQGLSQKMNNTDCYDFFVNDIISNNESSDNVDNGKWIGYGWVDQRIPVSQFYEQPQFYAQIGSYNTQILHIGTFGDIGKRNALQEVGFTLWGYDNDFSLYFNESGVVTSLPTTNQQVLTSRTNPRNDVKAVRFTQPTVPDCIDAPSSVATLAYRVHSYSNSDTSDTGSWGDWKNNNNWAFDADYTDSGIFTGFKTIDGIQFSIIIDNHYYDKEDNNGPGGPFPGPSPF